MNGPAPALQVSLRATLGAFRIDLGFTAPATGITALFGPSGAGKSTILRCIAGLSRQAEGRITFADERWMDGDIFVPAHRRPIGYVFQEADLFGHLTVAENLRFGLRRAQAVQPAIGFDQVVERLGLQALLQRSPGSLSGGERQRVAIGRAFLTQPRLLLVDEPLSAVDHPSRDGILTLIETLCRDLAIPAVYVTHDLAEMTRLAHHLVLIDAGKLVAAGPLDSLLTDLSLPLATQGEAGVVLDGTVEVIDHAFGLTHYRVEGALLMAPSRGQSLGARSRLRVLASDVSLCREPPQGTTILNVLPGIIRAAHSFDGMQTNVLIQLGQAGEGTKLLARVTRKSWEGLGFAPGQKAHALVKGVGLLAGLAEG